VNQTSLRFRLLLAWAIFIALLLQVAGLGLRVLFERSITRKTHVELAADLRQLKRGMSVAPDGTITIVRQPTDPQFEIAMGGRYWQVSEGDRVAAKSRSLQTEALTIPTTHTGRSDPDARTWIFGPKREQLYAVVEDYNQKQDAGGGDRKLTIITAVEASEIREDTDKFSSDLWTSLWVLSGLLFAGAWIHVAIGLRPLERLRASVVAVRRGETRSIEGVFPDEVMPLVTETNELLEAQRAALKVARERAADLAHGLKTPLAVMAAKSRQIRAKGEDEIASDVDGQIELMRRHVERELARARARGASPTEYGQIDVAPLVEDLVSAIQTLPRGQSLDWNCEIPQRLVASVDADDFNNMVGNLLENAEKWAHTRIAVAAVRSDFGFQIAIEDDGAGIPEHDLARVVRRGERADTSVSGSGLGLAIVRDLVDAYKGRLDLSRSRLGGLKVELFLPDAHGTA
jgi:signal transduction histidine kinase